jgi:hypothetical protein
MMASQYIVTEASMQAANDSGGVQFYVCTQQVLTAHSARADAYTIVDQSVDHAHSWEEDLPALPSDNAEDYCAADSSGRLYRQVTMYFDTHTQTWTSTCTCKQHVARGFNCQHMLAVAMTFDASRPYTISLSMFNHIFRTKNPLTDTDSLTPRVLPSSSDDTLAASLAKKLQHARSLFTTQMNYTQGYHASRDMCLRVQHDPEVALHRVVGHRRCCQDEGGDSGEGVAVGPELGLAE